MIVSLPSEPLAEITNHVPQYFPFSQPLNQVTIQAGLCLYHMETLLGGIDSITEIGYEGLAVKSMATALNMVASLVLLGKEE